MSPINLLPSGIIETVGNFVGDTEGTQEGDVEGSFVGELEGILLGIVVDGATDINTIG